MAQNFSIGHNLRTFGGFSFFSTNAGWPAGVALLGRAKVFRNEEGGRASVFQNEEGGRASIFPNEEGFSGGLGGLFRRAPPGRAQEGFSGGLFKTSF